MTRKEKINAAVDLVVSRDYGDVITHQEFIAMMHESGITPSYRDAINAAAKKCIECGKMIESVHGKGYRVVAPDEYTDQSVRCVMSGAKKIDNGNKILLHAPVNDMTQPGLEAYNRVSDRMRVLQASLAGAKVEIKMLEKQRQHPLAIVGRSA